MRDSRSSRKPVALHAFSEHAALGQRLARRLGWSFRQVNVRKFPDGESLVRVQGTHHVGPVVLLRSLDDPNPKIVECLLASETLRERGASSVSLVAPYLAYMRQDMAFHAGEAVSQRILGKLIDGYFDRLYTLDAHLHRTTELAQVFRVPAFNLSATPVIARRIRDLPDVVLVGPDKESDQWIRAIAHDADVPFVVATKKRLGDRQVRIRMASDVALKGKTIVLVDDIVSSGHTMLEAARVLRVFRPASIHVFVVHALFAAGAEEALRRARLRVVSTNCVPHATNQIDIAPVLADALRRDEKEL